MDDAMKAVLAAFGEIAASRRVGGAARRMTTRRVLRGSCRGLRGGGGRLRGDGALDFPAAGGRPGRRAADLGGGAAAAVRRPGGDDLAAAAAPARAGGRRGRAGCRRAGPAVSPRPSRLIEENKGAALLAALLAGAATENAHAQMTAVPRGASGVRGV